MKHEARVVISSGTQCFLCIEFICPLAPNLFEKSFFTSSNLKKKNVKSDEGWIIEVDLDFNYSFIAFVVLVLAVGTGHVTNLLPTE